jgi:pyrroloquinoline quinone (PQQ) biosynthesis protein C
MFGGTDMSKSTDLAVDIITQTKMGPYSLYSAMEAQRKEYVQIWRETRSPFIAAIVMKLSQKMRHWKWYFELDRINSQ